MRSVFLWAAIVAISATLLVSTDTLGETRRTAPVSLAVAAVRSDLPPNAPEVLLGDRLFFETRFAQFFYEHSRGDVNSRSSGGDPITEEVPLEPGGHFLGVGAGSLRGPFRGSGINCRQCHLGDDFIATKPLAQRTYCDFARRSPVPYRGDGITNTVRNSPVMVNLGLPRESPLLLHFDGEFSSVEDLVFATLTGRNYGWLSHERPTAIAHIASVIRQDAGQNARRFISSFCDGGPYKIALLGADPTLPPSLRIPPEYRIEVASASDEQIVWAIGKLIHAYMNSLRFGKDNTQRESEAPYDLFLRRNSLPNQPRAGEAGLEYSARLLRAIESRRQFIWINPADAQFSLHAQDYQFGRSELDGLKIFLQRSHGKRHIGNCVSCHVPPQFTDSKVHNTGVSQAEYDEIFGPGAFITLHVPGLAERSANFDYYMPKTYLHRNATSRFRSAPVAEKAGFADLGTWNVLANPDFPSPQSALIEVLCPKAPRYTSCEPESLLSHAIATFKTPTVRDLGHSGPYFHSGAASSIESVVRFYVEMSRSMRGGGLRNGSPEMAHIFIDSTDVTPLVAFLRTLNEDYH